MNVVGVSSKWTTQAEALRAEFTAAEPFPLLVLDEFLEPEFAADLLADFPAIDAMPKSRDYMFGDKHELSSIEAASEAGKRFHSMATSPEFESFLAEATGFDVWVDPLFHGGGFHQGKDGSFLDMHVDFNIHPLHDDWLRTINVLIYFNQNWLPEYKGELLVKSSPDGPERAIAPLHNRAVIMLTSDFTFHGYRRMSLPDGITRKSLATYAYRKVDADIKARTTSWIPEQAGIMKRVVARNYASLVKAKNRVFGSSTARNR